jgi:hypothetical protein
MVTNDLVNHIRIFEVLPPALYEWHSRGDEKEPCGVALAHRVNNSLCVDQAASSVIESQRFDTLVTQHWLRVALWRLVFGERPSASRCGSTLLPFSVPVDAGRAIMESLHSVSQTSLDCHAIAIVSFSCIRLILRNNELADT